MLNHEGSHHEHFEELCAIAASGQISEAEFVELQDHLQQCSDCRSASSDFVDLVHDKLPLAHPDIVGSSKLPGFFSETSSYRERFLARARMEGVAVPLETSRRTVRGGLLSWLSPSSRKLQLAPIGVVSLLVIVGVLSYALYENNRRYTKLVSDHAELNRQLSQRAPVVNLPRESPDPPAGLTSRVDRKTADELSRVRTENAAAEMKVLDDQLTKLTTELEALRVHNDQTNASREELQKKLKDAEELANAVREDLLRIRQARSRDALTMAAQDLEIRRISEKLVEQAELLAQERELLQLSRDVRDLMGSRSFHIADVFEVDSKGKDQQAFGRILYTKSTLIFYAFDLNERDAAKRNTSFQVWGKRGSGQTLARSLGLFQIDDQEQKRWVLRCEDPQILAQIDSVFVTVEPAGGSAKPTGRQFLYAYLDTNSK